MYQQMLLNTLYIGTHPDTPAWINHRPFRVVAVSSLSFLESWSFNPIDLLFLLVVKLHKNDTSYLLKRLVFTVWLRSSSCSSKTFLRYKDWLKLVIDGDIEIIDADDEDSIRKCVQKYDIKICVINCWSLLSVSLLDLLQFGFINIHPSKLPMYRGAVPTLWALCQGENSLAVSFFKLNHQVDGGELLAQHAFSVPSSRNALEVEEVIDAITRDHLHTDLVAYVKGDSRLFRQEGNSCATPRYEEYKKIKCESESTQDIFNKILLYPYLDPNTFCYVDTRVGRIYIHSIHVQRGTGPLSQKRVIDDARHVTLTGCAIYLNAKDGVLCARLFRDVSFRDSLRILRLYMKYHKV